MIGRDIMKEYKPIKRDSLSKQVSDKLEKMIESGEYEVGQKIPTEPELMNMFQVSRNTIREAVQSLTWAGILEVRQGAGTYVRASSQFNANMKKKFETESIADLSEARNCIEVTIAHLAASRRREDDIEVLKSAYEKRRELKAGCKENTKADIEFHMAIAAACHNPILIDLYTSIFDYIESYIEERNLDIELDVDRVERLHKELYEAVIGGYPDKAAISAKKIVEL